MLSQLAPNRTLHGYNSGFEQWRLGGMTIPGCRINRHWPTQHHTYDDDATNDIEEPMVLASRRPFGTTMLLSFLGEPDMADLAMDSTQLA